MKPERILQSDVLDIVFENRNKEYGAYELRKHYQGRMKKALLTMLGVVVVFAVLQSWKVPHKRISVLDVKDLDSLRLVEMTIKKDPPKLIIPKQVKPVAAINYQTYVVVPDKFVHDTLHTMDELVDKQISNKDIAGRPADGNEILSPANDGGNKGGEIEAKDKIEYDVPLRHAEIMPQFPGGMEAFLKFMQRNLKQPEDFDEGQKMVVLASFVVDAGGNIVNIAIDQKARPDLDAEVLRVIKKMPVWEPGMQNGRKVPVFYKLPVTFIAGD
jgi:protein TonB